jgi:hypothetical protein
LTTTPPDQNNLIRVSRKHAVTFCASAIGAALALCGCGLVFQAGTRYREHRMLSELLPGETMTDVRQDWGEPDRIDRVSDDVEIWSYAAKPNTNDPVAFTVYTSAKGGDNGTFLDLKMVHGRLASWSEAEHTLPMSQSGGFGVGMRTGSPPNPTHF